MGADAGVIAVVVTYNRKELLLRCLAALRAQQVRPDRVLLIDNASSDGTPEALRAAGWLEDGWVDLRRQAANLGGAGGFAAGIAAGLALEARWLWLLDDDTLPEPGCLAGLLRVAQAPRRRAPALLASRVLWTDRRQHPMNRCKPMRGADRAAPVWPMRGCSFVSCLVAGWAARRAGLPVAAYRLWVDDVEYTHRLTRHGGGIAVANSIAIHHTVRPDGVLTAPADRLFLLARNATWALRWSACYTAGERPLQALRLAQTLVRAWLARPTRMRLGAILGGLAAGFGSRPR